MHQVANTVKTQKRSAAPQAAVQPIAVWENGELHGMCSRLRAKALLYNGQLAWPWAGRCRHDVEQTAQVSM